MLESITLKEVATYDAAGIEIKGLKKINFIYGANGCGKTTMTKLIYNPKDNVYSNCFLKWQGDLSMPALVYNKDFRDRNFGKGNIDGVFTLGEATKEEIDAINEMKKDLDNLKEQGIKKRETLNGKIEEKKACDDEFRDVAWDDIYKVNEFNFKAAFVGYMKKESFKLKILTEYRENSSPLLSLQELVQKSQTIFGKVPVIMTLINTIDFVRLIEIEKDEIWEKRIIGKGDVGIAGLIQKLGINDWISIGRSYVQKEDNTCPFCQASTITDDFRKQLEEYFDETFTRDTFAVKVLSEEYIRISQNALSLVQTIESTEKGNPESKINAELFSALLKTLNSQLLNNKEVITNKIKEPSRSVKLLSTKEQFQELEVLIANANQEIRVHNDIVNDYENQKNVLIKSIWRYLVELNKGAIEAFIRKIDGFDKAINGLEKLKDELGYRYRELDRKIKDANSNVTSVQHSIDEINRILKFYGFVNFEIVPSVSDANQYCIQRKDGSIADSTLSEGEVTFITFLYFLQLAKGSTVQETITDNRILVIDDPISSLDSNILFVVSALIKEVIKGIKEDKGSVKQLILLTHNVYFHKEVSFIDCRTKNTSDYRFWILRRNDSITTVQCFGMENPIQNSYELLWQELTNQSNKSDIAIQNIMRRIIENYFKILGKYADDRLIGSFDNSQEQEICRSLVSWINDGSHCIPDDLYVEQHGTTISRYFDVFKRIFIQMGHEAHYNMMYKEPKETSIPVLA